VISDNVIETIEGGEYDFIKLNFPNGYMVGHTGNYEAVICSLEALAKKIINDKAFVATVSARP